MADRIVTVFGGSGFVGRYVVARLAARGCAVRIAVRDPEKAALSRGLAAPGRIVPMAVSIEREAMACRVPLVAYAVGGNPETVHDPWCVVPFGDVDGLTARVERLVDDPTFRAEMGAAAERYVRATFDAPVLAARQQGIYEEILGRPLA